MTDEPMSLMLTSPEKRDKLIAGLEKLTKLQELVDKQAEDMKLWFGADPQLVRSALRDLHALIEE